MWPDVYPSERPEQLFNRSWMLLTLLTKRPRRWPKLIFGRREKRKSGKRVLLVGHMDTVFEPSSPFQKFAKARRLSGQALRI